MRTEEQKVEDVIRRLDSNCPLCHPTLLGTKLADYCNEHLLRVEAFLKKENISKGFVYKEIARRGLKP